MASVKSKEKANFRNTALWKTFREHMASKYNNRDAITGEKLRKGWQLHHLDLDAEHYKDLIEDHFIPLNVGTHELIHRLFLFCKKEAQVEKMKSALQKMYELNNVKENGL